MSDFASRTPAQSGTAITVPLHDPAAQSSFRSTTSSSASAQPAAADRETFAALDSATSGPDTTWIRAGAHHAEAGYLDPSLGWVSVRADSTASGVHAALVPGSPEAASALGNHLAGLNAFLADHHGQASPVTLASPASAGSHAGNLDNSANDTHRQRQQQESNPSAPSSPRAPEFSARSPVQQFPGVIPAPDGSGIHVSVMA
jgi:hypothetical protein